MFSLILLDCRCHRRDGSWIWMLKRHQMPPKVWAARCRQHLIDGPAHPLQSTVIGKTSVTWAACISGGPAAITAFAHVPEAGALCISDASGRLLMVDIETRAIEEASHYMKLQHVHVH